MEHLRMKALVADVSAELGWTIVASTSTNSLRAHFSGTFAVRLLSRRHPFSVH